jgi:hypothetical protein
LPAGVRNLHYVVFRELKLQGFLLMSFLPDILPGFFSVSYWNY